MKYMTKEWYETDTDLHLLLRVSKKAETFSEEYFRKLYKQEEEEWLKLQKAASEVKFEDIFPEDFSEVESELYELDLSPSEIEAAKEEYIEERERARLDFEELPPFDEDAERKNFKRRFNFSKRRLKEVLPDEVLQKVADIRVLALHRASAEVKKDITRFCKQNEKAVISAPKAYDKEFRKQFGSDAPAFAEKLNLHDCLVLSCRRKGNDVVLTLDNRGGFTNINTVTMKNCTVLKQDGRLHGAWCLYEEIYKAENQYEIHLLLLKNELIDFIVLADNLEYKYD